MNETGERWLAFAREDLLRIPTLYPDAVPDTLPGGLPRLSDAEEALDLARRALRRIEGKL